MSRPSRNVIAPDNSIQIQGVSCFMLKARMIRMMPEASSDAPRMSVSSAAAVAVDLRCLMTTLREQAASPLECKFYRGARLARMRCRVRRCMFSRRAVSETLRLHIS